MFFRPSRAMMMMSRISGQTEENENTNKTVGSLCLQCDCWMAGGKGVGGV